MAGGWTTRARFVRDGRLVATVSEDGMRWWDTETGKMLRHISGSRSTPVSFCGDTDLAVTTSDAPGSPDKRYVRILDLETGNTWKTIPAGAAAACSQDLRWAIVNQGKWVLWDLKADRSAGVLPDVPNPEMAVFTADGTRLLSANWILEIPSCRVIAQLTNSFQPEEMHPSFANHRGFTRFGLFGQDRFMATASDFGNVAIWNVRDGSPAGSLSVVKPRCGMQFLAAVETLYPAISALAGSPGGKHVAVADFDNRITVRPASGPQKPLSFVEVIPDDNRPVTRFNLDDNQRRISGVVTSLRVFR
jgi:WD40 repeat protein